MVIIIHLISTKGFLMKKIWVCLLLCHSMALFAAKSELAVRSYGDLKYWHMRSAGVKETDLAKPADVASEKNKKLDFTLPTYDLFTRQLMLCDILGRSLQDSFGFDRASQAQRASADIMVRDLELLCGDGAAPAVNVASLTDRTGSAGGSMVYRKMLTLPLASVDFEQFKDRQKLIKRLIEDENLFNEVSSLCSAYAANEELMLANWQDFEGANKELYNRIFFTSDMFAGLNKSPAMMEFCTRFQNFGAAFSLTFFELYTLFANAYTLQEDNNRMIRFDADKNCLIQNKHMSYPEAVFKVIAKSLKWANPFYYFPKVKKIIARIEESPYRDASAARKLFYITIPTAAAVFLFVKGYTVKKVLEEANSRNEMMKFMQKRLMGLAHVVHAVEKMDLLQRSYPELARGLMTWQHGQMLLHPMQQDDFTTLVELLKTKTFTGEPSFFSCAGRIFAATKFAESERDKFAGVIELIGELDACLSVAKLYKEYQGRRVSYSVVDVVERETPCIQLEGFWNPFVDHNVVVPNDIFLGGKNPEQHVILTGSNTGGKSTVGLKGTLLSLYLGHTFGIAPASRCYISRFSTFSSYLRVTDDLASGESAFQAEINRANALIKSVNGMEADQCAFVVIDELFKGTSPEKGMPAASKVTRYLADRKNVIFILATHYKELTELEKEIPSIVNMKMEIFEDASGNLIKPYKLEKGVSTHNVAENLLEHGLQFDSASLVI